MTFESRYHAKQADEKGYVSYTDSENAVWGQLYQRQIKILPGRACDEYIHGIDLLGLNEHAIPQLPDVSACLLDLTGWKVAPVPALITPEAFFDLLLHRTFPAATFIRDPAELDYVTEPDIFHELFGHCPMLTHRVFADFVYAYASCVVNMDKKHWPLMQRLFWFTNEFGLLNTNEGPRCYGGGILSSFSETQYAVDSDIPDRLPFDLVSIFRTPYRIDILQPIYYVIESYEQLYGILKSDLQQALSKAYELGEFPPKFKTDGSANEHIHCC